ncbi:hypothetical protein AXF42_Ash005115 [Apostasia shenzhenica]|uniref:Uncharacterized protein n=1 Tax=Apostasia shenzhenica TaxID=1088818 RepID=A0A2I0B8I2_9ASPA|nr:hypothetical protein AXF42_Ash005115 [Apostasia shenzhenica]
MPAYLLIFLLWKYNHGAQTCRCFLESVGQYGMVHFELALVLSSFESSLFPEEDNRNFIKSASMPTPPSGIKAWLLIYMEYSISNHLRSMIVSVGDIYYISSSCSIDVISEAFEGVSAVNRQRMVYKAIWEELEGTVHAVDQMTTRTPAEAAGK